MTELENVNITNMVMNTAQGHFNLDQMEKDPAGQDPLLRRRELLPRAGSRLSGHGGERPR